MSHTLNLEEASRDLLNRLVPQSNESPEIQIPILKEMKARSEARLKEICVDGYWTPVRADFHREANEHRLRIGECEKRIEDLLERALKGKLKKESQGPRRSTDRDTENPATKVADHKPTNAELMWKQVELSAQRIKLQRPELSKPEIVKILRDHAVKESKGRAEPFPLATYQPSVIEKHIRIGTRGRPSKKS